MDDASRSRDTPLRTLTSVVDMVHLRHAVAAADYGSFRRAADALRLRQSTLSRCIRQLEQSIGMTVFERSSGGVRATEAGRSFLRLARSILEQVDALVMTAHRTGRGETGQLTIGFYTSLSAGNLRATLIDYSQRFPEIALSLIESSRARLVTALRNGAIDVAIVTGQVPFPDSRLIPLWSERILVVLPQEHRLAVNETIYWSDLKGETLLLGQRDPGSEIQDLLTARLISPQDRPQVVRYDVSRESIKNLIGAGFGIGLTLEASLGVNFSGVVHREVRDGTGPIRIDHSANWRGDNENPALASFLKLLQERYPTPSI
jgi:DNA-binding transcriptional LysR family regulator